MREPGPPATPVLDKMRAVHGRPQAVGDSLEWLGRKGYVLSRRAEGEAACFPYLPAGRSVEEPLAEYFEIDLGVAERERRAVLDYVHRQRVWCQGAGCSGSLSLGCGRQNRSWLSLEAFAARGRRAAARERMPVRDRRAGAGRGKAWEIGVRLFTAWPRPGPRLR